MKLFGIVVALYAEQVMAIGHPITMHFPGIVLGLPIVQFKAAIEANGTILLFRIEESRFCQLLPSLPLSTIPVNKASKAITVRAVVDILGLFRLAHEGTVRIVVYAANVQTGQRVECRGGTLIVVLSLGRFIAASICVSARRRQSFVIHYRIVALQPLAQLRMTIKTFNCVTLPGEIETSCGKRFGPNVRHWPILKAPEPGGFVSIIDFYIVNTVIHLVNEYVIQFGSRQ